MWPLPGQLWHYLRDLFNGQRVLFELFAPRIRFHLTSLWWEIWQSNSSEYCCDSKSNLIFVLRHGRKNRLQTGCSQATCGLQMGLVCLPVLRRTVLLRSPPVLTIHTVRTCALTHCHHLPLLPILALKPSEFSESGASKIKKVIKYRKKEPFMLAKHSEMKIIKR